jgi:hypothetical protein
MADSSACWNGPVPVLENNATVITQYLNKAGIDKNLQKGGVYWLSGECLKRHRIVYCHKNGTPCNAAVTRC